MNTTDILTEQLKAMENARSHVLVTIAESQNKAARSFGKMLVFEDGSSVGTVGGGQIEPLAKEDALRILQTGETVLKEYDLESEASANGEICGGKLKLLFEPYRAKPLLVMIGAGHVGRAVIQLARFIGFDTLLMDDRDKPYVAELAKEAGRFIRLEDIRADVAAAQLPAGCYIVIASHGHSYDADALYAALDKDAAYVGMIGSKPKVASIFEKLQSEGVAPEKLAGVHSPIGLDIGGETPEEIAVSIIAEILQTRYERNGMNMAVFNRTRELLHSDQA